MIGMSKDTPDERVVRTHQTLAVPPDLQLRPPSGESQTTGTTNPYAQDAENSAQSVNLNNPPADGTYAPATTEDLYNEPVSPAPGTQTSTAVAAPAPAPAPAVDVYAKYGVSRTNPDGTEKSVNQLNSELRKKKLEQEQAKNPDYGTIFNIGDMFN